MMNATTAVYFTTQLILAVQNSYPDMSQSDQHEIIHRVAIVMDESACSASNMEDTMLETIVEFMASRRSAASIAGFAAGDANIISVRNFMLTLALITVGLLAMFRKEVEACIAIAATKAMYKELSSQQIHDIQTTLKYAQEREKPEKERDPNIAKPGETTHNKIINILIKTGLFRGILVGMSLWIDAVDIALSAQRSRQGSPTESLPRTNVQALIEDVEDRIKNNKMSPEDVDRLVHKLENILEMRQKHDRKFRELLEYQVSTVLSI